MSKKVTSIALLNVNGMQKICITHSEIDEKGVITEDNKRTSRVVVDNDVNSLITKLYDFAQEIVDSE